eukprot:3714-Heterococcus_DN1.PRE.2
MSDTIRNHTSSCSTSTMLKHVLPLLFIALIINVAAERLPEDLCFATPFSFPTSVAESSETNGYREDSLFVYVSCMPLAAANYAEALAY